MIATAVVAALCLSICLNLCLYGILRERATPPPPPRVTTNRRRPLAPGIVPRGTPTYGGRLASRLEARTAETPAVDTAELRIWDAEAAAEPPRYLCDGSPVRWRPDGTIARAHESYPRAHRYEPLGANQRRLVGAR